MMLLPCTILDNSGSVHEYKIILEIMLHFWHFMFLLQLKNVGKMIVLCFFIAIKQCRKKMNCGSVHTWLRVQFLLQCNKFGPEFCSVTEP